MLPLLGADVQAAEEDSELSGRGTESTAAPPRLGGIRLAEPGSSQIKRFDL